jgi:hypothetical protein
VERIIVIRDGDSIGESGGWLEAAEEEYIEGSWPTSERGERVLILSEMDTRYEYEGVCKRGWVTWELL